MRLIINIRALIQTIGGCACFRKEGSPQDMVEITLDEITARRYSLYNKLRTIMMELEAEKQVK